MNPASPDQDVSFLRRAIRLAMAGRGCVEPNPMVGCLLFRDGRVIGEGWHERFGGPHAEPNALAYCRASGNDPAGATVYVTLEPCCHTDKKTPPCVPALVAAKVARVVVGCLDPNPAVNGRGMAALRAAGIAVDGPVLEAEAKQLIAPFLARVRLGRPYVTLKWAETADGKVAGPGGRRLQISNAASSRLVHQLRARSDAIVVGVRTAINDDPMLTARGVPDARPLTRAVLDRLLELPATGKLAATAAEHPVMVFCSDVALRDRPAAADALRGLGVELAPVPMADGRLDLDAVLREFGRRGVTHLLAEPGPALAAGFRDRADRTWVIRSPVRLGDPDAPCGIAVNWPATGSIDVAGDTVTEYLRPRSEAYFAAVPSADFVLAGEVMPAADTPYSPAPSSAGRARPSPPGRGRG